MINIQIEIVLSISDNLEGLTEQLTDNDFQIQLVTNGQKHLERYFSNPTTASENWLIY